MRDFMYHNPTRLFFGRGQIDALASEIPATAHVMLVAGAGSIRQNGTLDKVRTALADRRVIEFFGIEPNPDLSTILRAREVCRAEGADYLLAVGGGSVIDATKFLAALAQSTEEPSALLSRPAKIVSALPVGVVLTAPGTGSESNPHAAISNRATAQKQIISSSHCQPRFAILDPESTYSLSAHQRANGIVDAYVHVIEQYLTSRTGAVVADRLAEGLLLSLHECGPKAMLEPTNYEASANWMWGANLALNGLIGQGVPQDWTTHHIGHELTALFGIEHARTLAAVLPAVLSVRRAQKLEKLVQYGERVLGIQGGTDEERADEAILRLKAFFESLGVSTHLGTYGFAQPQIPAVIAQLKASRRIRMGERLDVSLDHVASILSLAI